MVNVLVEFGGNVNAQNSTGMTPLMFASIQGHSEIVRVLLQHGSLVNIVDKKDFCAMGKANFNSYFYFLMVILSRFELVH